MDMRVTIGRMSFFYGFSHVLDHGRLRFACVTDVRDSSTGLPGRRPGAGVPSDAPSRQGAGRRAMPPQFSTEPGPQGADFPGYGQPESDALARRQPGSGAFARQPGAPARPPGPPTRRPARQPQARLRPPGRPHRPPMPASLPEGAPAAGPGGRHHGRGEAGRARAAGVRMFSIRAWADGIILATVGGEGAVGTASVTAFLLAARLALPVMAASLDAKPTIEEAAAQLEGMGVNRIALAPYVIGPEADPAAIEEAAAVIGGKCCAPLRAHGNGVKRFSLASGLVL